MITSLNIKNTIDPFITISTFEKLIETSPKSKESRYTINTLPPTRINRTYTNTIDVYKSVSQENRGHSQTKRNRIKPISNSEYQKTATKFMGANEYFNSQDRSSVERDRMNTFSISPISKNKQGNISYDSETSIIAKMLNKIIKSGDLINSIIVFIFSQIGR